MDVESPAAAHEIGDEQIQIQLIEIPVPAHRYSPVEKAWAEIYSVVHEEMGNDIRMNPEAPSVELKSRTGGSPADLQKCADLLRALMLGFNISDAVVIFRSGDLRIESFEMNCLRMLTWQYLTHNELEILTGTRMLIEIEKSMVHVIGSSATVHHVRVLLNCLIGIQFAPECRRPLKVKALYYAIRSI